MQTSSRLVCKERREGKDDNNIFPKSFSFVCSNIWLKETEELFNICKPNFCQEISFVQVGKDCTKCILSKLLEY